ncbi:hypothetical protein [Methylobacterium tarhaniae]|nr:hypothetical protein [Methylobacterium tarhaniae]
MRDPMRIELPPAALMTAFDGSDQQTGSSAEPQRSRADSFECVVV